MPSNKKPNPKAIEQSQFRVFNPEDVKQTVEIPVKPKPSIEEIETIEKVGTKKPIKNTKKRVTPTKKSKTSKDSIETFSKPITLKKSGYTLIITEKPQAAEKIAAALSNGKDNKINRPGGVSYYELERNNKKIVVACAVGHLFSVAQSKRETGYPVFNIGWKPNYEVRKADFTKKYYLTILSLVKGASEIIVATDFDIEGEVIGYNIVRFIAQQQDAKRMKFSALTSDEIQNAYENAHPTIEWGQAIAGETRHFLDWMYGINLSRALMSAIKTTGKFRIMSIGRVQGPTLKLIVEKEKQIRDFKSSPYWQVFITINNNKSTLELKHIKDIIKKQELDKFKELKGKKAIASTTKTQQVITPPAPFDLTTLQIEAYKFHGITPANTLQVAQKLYLGGLISYPRTSSQKIPEAMNPQKILKQLEKKNSLLTKHATRNKPVEGNKSDPAHPAIIPTGTYAKLTDYDEKIYNLIMKRFISCFCADAKLANKKVEAEINGLKFNTRGMEVLEAGWMNVYPAKMEEKQIKDFNGEVKIDNVKIEEKETQPPKRYSPASIITELEKRSLGTKCLTGDTKVIFNGELTKIEELFNSGKVYTKEKDTEIKEINGKTISFLEKEEYPIITSPLFISKRKIKEDESVIQIETDSSIINLTEDHLVYVLRDNKIQQIKSKELKLSDNAIGIIKNLKYGNIIITQPIFDKNFKEIRGEILHKFSQKKSRGIRKDYLPIKWSNSLAWVLGYYYGDGSYSNPKYNGSHQVYFTTTERKALNLLKENIKNIFGIEPYAYNLGNTYKVNCNSVMSYFLAKCFPEIEGKNPLFIPHQFKGEFLKGFFDADGNIHLRPKGTTKIKGIKCHSFNTPRVKFTLANEKLIIWVKDLLSQIGIQTKINKGIAKCNGKTFNCWTILISGRDKIEKFAYKIGFSNYKEDLLYKGLKCDSCKYKVLKNSAKICLILNKSPLKIEELEEESLIKKYELRVALKRLVKLGMINKKRYTNRNKNIYTLIDKSIEFINHCMKLLYEKNIFGAYNILINKISKKQYSGYVYDISIEEDSPNFVIEGNLLVHNSTRANIIETLYQRNYVKDKSIKATELGIKLIESMEKHSPIIIDEKLTREMEKDMESIRNSKKDLNQKQAITIEKAKTALIKISADFKKQEVEIGKELVNANQALWDSEKEENKLGLKCPLCNKGDLTLKFTPRFKSYFIACSEYPNCKQTFSLPSNSLIKKTDKVCESCKWPMLLRIKAAKHPWIFCPNPKCESKKELDINGNTKEKEERYVGK